MTENTPKPQRDRRIVEMALQTNPKLTYREIGQRVGEEFGRAISRQRVEQILKQYDIPQLRRKLSEERTTLREQAAILRKRLSEIEAELAQQRHDASA